MKSLDQRLVYLQSWWIASELVRGHPSLKVVETHPGGGQYDCLSIVTTEHYTVTLIDLNRSGSIHVLSEIGGVQRRSEPTFGGNPFPMSWERERMNRPGFNGDIVNPEG